MNTFIIVVAGLLAGTILASLLIFSPSSRPSRFLSRSGRTRALLRAVISMLGSVLISAICVMLLTTYVGAISKRSMGVSRETASYLGMYGFWVIVTVGILWFTLKVTPFILNKLLRSPDNK